MKDHKRNRLVALAALALLILNSPLSTVHAQGTAFTYQGRLNSGDAPANGSYDIAFTLFATNTSGVATAGPVTISAVGVTNGLFTTTVDFGNVFTGSSNWLEIAVSASGANAFSTLLPRQQLTPVPYAITAANLSGAILPSQLPASIITNGASGVNVSGTFTGSGAGLTNVTATTLAPNSFVAVYTTSYSVHGTYSFAVPPHVSQIVVKLWGASGGNGDDSLGGAGAFSQVTLAVTRNEGFTVVVGEGGNATGGAGTNDGSGGAGAGGLGGSPGGQASSFFLSTGTNYIMKAVAGAGGGGGSMIPGGDGLGYSTVTGYSTNALTIGETNLDLMGGDGGSGDYPGGGGGGGGGYGGGQNAGEGESTGGGSYGDIMIGGSDGNPGNESDPNYVSGAGFDGNDGLVVVIFYSYSLANVPASVQAVSFAGDGSGLTDLNASMLNAGTVPLAQLPAGLVTDNESGVNLSGGFSGDGSGLTNLNASAFSAGFFPLALLPSAVVTNGGNNVMLSGAFSGDGSGLSNVSTTLPSDGGLVFTNEDVGLGYQVLGGPAPGYFNTAVGYSALVENNNGFNTVIGAEAMYYTTGSNNIAIGYLAGFQNIATSADNNIDIGNQGATGGENGVTRIGTPGVQTMAYLAGVINGNGGGLTNLNATQLTGTLPLARLSAAVVTNNAAGLDLGGTFSGTFSGNGNGLTSLNPTNLSGTLQAANFPATVVTNFAAAGQLGPDTFSFTSHGGTLLITTDGSGSTNSAPAAIGMVVGLDGTAITTNHVWVNVSSVHATFVSQTIVRRGVTAGSHAITLSSWNGTTTDINDNFSVTVQELPY